MEEELRITKIVALNDFWHASRLNKQLRPKILNPQ